MTKNRAAAPAIHNLCTACPALAHSFIHNILWCGEEADTNSSFPPEHVNLDLVYSAALFGALQKPMENQSFSQTGSPNIEQKHGWMRAGAEKRPPRPMPAWKISVLASTYMACVAQILLNLYAHRGRGGGTGRPGKAGWP
jgi:hypothetical protein